MEVTFHRFVLAEFNTHRAFSRNSASSRAIPAHKMIKRVVETPAIPLAWPKEQSGMQGGESVDEQTAWEAENVWLDAADAAVLYAQRLVDLGIHKSLANRLLEPFLWHTVIVTATDYENFFKQRCSPLAQPEIRAVAELMMLEAYDRSTPKLVHYGEWHTPYVDKEESLSLLDAIAVSVARCARVSYLTHDGKRDPQEDINLYNKLIKADPPHLSPLEHVATPGNGYMGNFLGWKQWRHFP